MEITYQMQLNICKKKMQNQRKELPEEEWKNYIKNSYPNWYEEAYGDSQFPVLGNFIKNSMWKVNIIFYPTNSENLTSQCHKYTFRINRHYTFNNILNLFSDFISKQHLTIKLIFGEDLYDILSLYIPNFKMIIDNYFYIHKHVYEIYENYREATKFIRQRLPGDQKLNCVRKYLNIEQNIDDLNIRLRAKKLSTTSRDFQKSHDYSKTFPYSV